MICILACLEEEEIFDIDQLDRFINTPSQHAYVGESSAYYCVYLPGAYTNYLILMTFKYRKTTLHCTRLGSDNLGISQ